MNRKKKLGASRLSNNFAELSALIEAMHWLLEELSDSPVLLRPDSELGARLLAGTADSRDPALRPLVRRGRELLAALREARRGVWIACVRAHQVAGNVWNARADALADRGARGWASIVGDRWSDWENPPGREPRVQADLDEVCPVCFEEFRDGYRPGVDATLPTPALGSRAPADMWQCPHALCRACAQGRDLQIYDRCPLCRAARRPAHFRP